jgi:hypothetical protein
VRRLRARIRPDERGASLVLAIAFTVVAGAIGASLLPGITSGVNGLSVLDTARNRQYAADAGIERSIARVRGLSNPGVTSCGSTDIYQPSTTPDPAFDPAHHGFPIRVDCLNVPAVTTGPGGIPVVQRDVMFTACLNTGSSCSDANDIIRAQVNYQGSGTGTVYVESWSVNG